VFTLWPVSEISPVVCNPEKQDHDNLPALIYYIVLLIHYSKMITEDLNAMLERTSSFSPDEITAISSRFKVKHVEHKVVLLAAGDVAREVYFLSTGCLRLYYLKDGKDISAYFFTEGAFAGAYDSFITKQPSRHSIEAVEQSLLHSISYPKLQELYAQIPRMNEFIRQVIEERFVALHQLFSSQILDSPEERYLNLLKYRPDLLQRIPLYQLATFLGVTPVSLSRVCL